MVSFNPLGGLDGQEGMSYADLQNKWIHQYPEGSGMADGAIQDGYNNGSYFNLTNGVLGLSVNEGDGTSQNSDSPRSELREAQEWNIGTGTNQMSGTYSIDDLSAGSTIAQLMSSDGDRDLPIVRVEQKDGKLKAVIRSRSGLDGADVEIDLGEITAGEKFQVGIQEVNGKVSISVNGEVPAGAANIDISGWNGSGAYFKAGNYFNGGAGNSPSSEVKLHDLDLAHNPEESEFGASIFD